MKALAVSEDGEVVGRAEVEYGLSTPKPGLGRAGPGATGGAPPQEALEELGADERRPASACRGRCTGSSRSTPTSRCCGRRSSGTTSARPPSATEIEARIGLERLIAATGNRALTGFTAPKLLWLRAARARGLRADRAHPAAEGLRAPAAAAASARSTSPTPPGTLLFDVAHRRWSDEVLRGARGADASGCRARSSRPRCRGRRATASRSPPGRATRRPARSASASTTRAGRCRSCSAPPASCSRALPAFAADARGARARVLPRGARRPGTRWA